MNNKPTTNNISLGFSKKAYTIDGDDSKVIYLDPSDMSILTRIQTFSEKSEPVFKKFETVTEEEFSTALTDIDAELRHMINELFDYDVCSVCLANGTLFDMMSGKFKFEIIIEGLSKVYTDTISAEMKLVSARMSAHTKKYTTKKKN